MWWNSYQKIWLDNYHPQKTSDRSAACRFMYILADISAKLQLLPTSCILLTLQSEESRRRLKRACIRTTVSPINGPAKNNGINLPVFASSREIVNSEVREMNLANKKSFSRIGTVKDRNVSLV